MIWIYMDLIYIYEVLNLKQNIVELDSLFS